MAGYIGSKASVTQIDGYTKTEAESRYANVSGDTFTGAVTGTDLTLSGGVYLGGTGSANKLDDYETGTWTPAVTYGGTTAYTGSNGQYIKIGAMVIAYFEITITNLNGGSGAIRITSLPFTPNGNMEYYHGNVQGNSNQNLPTGAGSIMPYVVTSANNVRLLYMTNTGHADINNTNFPVGVTMYGFINYTS